MSAPSAPPKTLRLSSAGFSTTAVLASALWIGAIVAGFNILLSYETKPGANASAPVGWPAASALHRAIGAPTLVMFAHPKCPCTMASIAQLEKLMTACPTLSCYVVFGCPKAEKPSWTRTALWQRASEMPHTQVVCDSADRESNLFGANTSGQVLLYDAKGTLIFNGGITNGRGHEGPNVGLDALQALVNQTSPAPHRTTVYGCPIADNAETSTKTSQECKRF